LHPSSFFIRVSQQSINQCTKVIHGFTSVGLLLLLACLDDAWTASIIDNWEKKMVVKVNHGLKWTIYDEMVDGSISN
jgi:hypothetical protein